MGYHPLLVAAGATAALFSHCAPISFPCPPPCAPSRSIPFSCTLPLSQLPVIPPHRSYFIHIHASLHVFMFMFPASRRAPPPSPLAYQDCRRWAEARIKITRMTLTIKLDRNWSSFQLANSAPPLSVTGSAIAPSARIISGAIRVGAALMPSCGVA